MLKPLKMMTAMLLLLFPFFSFSQHYNSDLRIFGGLNSTHFSTIQDNLKSTVYSFAFADMKNKNEFDFYSPAISFDFELGLSIPFAENWTYELGYSRSYASVKMTYNNLSNKEVSRNIRFTASSLNLLGLNYLFGKRQSIGISFPLTSGRLKYKSEGISGENENYKSISKRKLISHYTSIDMGFNYEYNLRKNLALRFAYFFNLFGGDVIFTENSTFYFNSNRSTFSIVYKY